MRELEIYLPTTTNDGARIDADEIAHIKRVLVDTFGGYTHLDQRFEGVWRIGGVTFRDEVTIVRVLDDGRTSFDLPAFKRAIETRLRQQEVLIVERDVRVV